MGAELMRPAIFTRSRCTGFVLATTWPRPNIRIICMVKASKFQKLTPQASIESASPKSVKAIAAARQKKVRKIAITSGSGIQRSPTRTKTRVIVFSISDFLFVRESR